MRDAAVINIGRRGLDALRRSSPPHLSAIHAIPSYNAVTSLPTSADSCTSVNLHDSKSPSAVLIHCFATRRFSSPPPSSEQIQFKATAGRSNEYFREKSEPFGVAADTVARPSLTKPPPQPPSSGNKSFFAKLWDKYSLKEQHKRSVLGEKLFRSAQYRANDL